MISTAATRPRSIPTSPRRFVAPRRAAGILALALTAAGCGDDPPLVSHPIRVGAAGAAAADVTFDYQGGALRIEPIDAAAADGALILFEGLTDREALRPVAIAAREGDTMMVRIHQPDADAARGKRTRNEWRVGLAPSTPTRLSVRAGVLGGRLALAGLDVPSLEIDANQGELEIDFTGAPLASSCDVRAEFGHGYVRVLVPAGVAVRVRSREAVGRLVVDGVPEVTEDEYCDPGFDEATTRLDLSLGVGMGQVQVERTP